MTCETCRKCGGSMGAGIAMAQTYTDGVLDFPGDDHATTFSAGGPGKIVSVSKCHACGWSVTGGHDAVAAMTGAVP